MSSPLPHRHRVPPYKEEDKPRATFDPTCRQYDNLFLLVRLRTPRNVLHMPSPHRDLLTYSPGIHVLGHPPFSHQGKYLPLPPLLFFPNVDHERCRTLARMSSE